ncbi:MAG: hypothetical protein NZL99_00990 [Burkholderiaceae bacterium]|nr:hypothetical protein [Burkholderiaceae bacterium]
MWWQIFGLLTLLVSVGAAMHARIAARWKGDAGVLPPDQPYKSQLHTHRGKVIRYYVGIEGARGFDFVLKPERWYDRLFKLLGISSEMQCGDPLFDRTWYIVSDDWLLRRALAGSAALRRDLLQLLPECARLQAELEYLQHQRGRLWLSLKPRSKSTDEAQRWQAECIPSLVPLLYRIAAHLAHLRPERFKDVRDRYARRSVVILSLSTGLAVYAAWQLIRLGFGFTPFLLDPLALLWQVAPLGLAALGAVVVVSMTVLGGTSRAHLVLLELLLVGSFAFVGTAFVLARDVNIDFDKSEPQAIEVSVQGVELRRRRRSRTAYLRVSDWDNPGRTRRIEVPVWLYRRVKPGDTVLFVQRAGYLGHRWIEAVSEVAGGRP